ncbi:MAG: glycosyltransferase [Phycisphaerales bacterium]
MRQPAPVLLLQPQGLTVTGVTTWAVRLAGELTRAGRSAGLVVHGSAGGHGEIECAIPRGVRVFRFDDLPPIESLAGDVAPIADAYEHAARSMGTGPVCLVPTRHGDCFGACAELTRRDPDAYRVIGWQHVASAYEDTLMARYEPIFSRFAAVSAFLASRLRDRFPARAGEVDHVPNAVDAEPFHRERARADGRPVRIIYTGRLEHEQKRVGALIAMSDALRGAATPHELTIVGDGPAGPWIDAQARTRPGVIRVSSVGPDAITPMLDASDILVLPSRTEGLSISVLEAMARGCVPVITDTPSGARELVADGESGVLVACAEEPETRTGERLAEGVRRAMSIGLETLGARSWARARTLFSPARFAQRAGAAFDAAAATPGRGWSSAESPAFSAPEGAEASGSAPAGAAERLAVRLGALLGKRVAIHGTGAHTRQLRPVIASSPNVVAFIDDDPAKAGSELWGLPIEMPDRAAELGVTDVVISSWMHEDAIWARRGTLEASGVRVHRLYADRASEAA